VEEIAANQQPSPVGIQLEDAGPQAGVAPPAPASPPAVVMLPGRVFVAGCAVAAGAIFVAGRVSPMPVWLLASEVLATIVGLFVLGSFKYQIHKNALTYGMLLVIISTFAVLPTSTWHAEIARQGAATWIGHHLLTFSGLDDLIHADTMLFILGLTLFVSVIAQTRVLEGVTFFLLRRNGGRILPTVLAVTAVVAIASGVLGGVSMIGLTIRTFVIILMLGAAPIGAIRYAVMVCTAVTTICGVWTAYGEPPNLIMKANLYPNLDNIFFLYYGLPVAVASFAAIAWQLRRRLGGLHVDLGNMDVLDANAEDVRFLQATRHGEVMTPAELIEGHRDELGAETAERVMARLGRGESLGIAMIRADVPELTRKMLLGHFVTDELADGLDRHYIYAQEGLDEQAFMAELAVDDSLDSIAYHRRWAQRIAVFALLPFFTLLIVHGFVNEVPLFLASFAGFLAALPGIVGLPRMRTLALREARLEYAEYYFLFPLFLSITLLTSAGFFDVMQSLVTRGIAVLGHSHVAFTQFAASTVLSAILDNNIVADFASRGLHGLSLDVLKFFAMAQIAGYALGGCWTHIGCAQSVVAYAFIQRDVDEHYTPVRWIKEMTPVIVQTMALMAVIIYVEGALLSYFTSGRGRF
jgi:citrate transporter